MEGLHKIGQISELRDRHSNQDIYVLAAGPTMNYVHRSFFDNKITIGVNKMCNYFRCDYIVAKDDCIFEDIVNHQGDAEIILSKFLYGNPENNTLNSIDTEHYTFDHPSKPQELPDLSVIEILSDKIVVSHSTITSAMHIAAYLGAKNIILCGHDCCEVDGKAFIDGYYDNRDPTQHHQHGYTKWLSTIKNHTSAVQEKIFEAFGCNIYALSPFLFNGNAPNPQQTARNKSP